MFTPPLILNPLVANLNPKLSWVVNEDMMITGQKYKPEGHDLVN
jgi:hypothetical protein